MCVDHGMPAETLVEYYIVHDLRTILLFLYLKNAMLWNKSSPMDFAKGIMDLLIEPYLHIRTHLNKFAITGFLKI